MDPSVDVVVLTRDERPLNSEVLGAIDSQLGVDIRLHRVVGTPRDGDVHRWQTIARARNVGRTLGNTKWLMFVDDDVVIGRNCISQLVEDLHAKPSFAASAADYLNERDPEGVSPHVAMGATLFRRDALARIEFRWEKSRCECQCMADDLRRNLLDIDYSVSATAVHLEVPQTDFKHSTSVNREIAVPESQAVETVDSGGPASASEMIVTPLNMVENSADYRDAELLVAFDRSHMGLFYGQFVTSLRESGNENTIHAVTYGLRDKHVQSLKRIAGVEVHPRPFSVHRVCRSRMLGFQHALRALCPKTPVAYWDAGDVVFQTSLAPLWDQIRQTPDKLLVVEEPLAFANNPGHQSWITSIVDPLSRQRVFSLLQGKPVINGGFIAGKAGRLLNYFEQANELINGELIGAGGGDQIVLNVYRNDHPEEFDVIDDTWNYCLVGRSGRQCKVKQGVYLDVERGRAVSVVHGNAGTLV